MMSSHICALLGKCSRLYCLWCLNNSPVGIPLVIHLYLGNRNQLGMPMIGNKDHKKCLGTDLGDD